MKTPKVVVGPHPDVEDRLRAMCMEPRCAWTYSNVVKTDVQEQAKHHRDHHRRQAGASS